MGAMSSPKQQVTGALIGLAKELSRACPNINMLLLLIVQYLYGVQHMNKSTLTRRESIVDTLSVEGPVSLRPYIRRLVNMRNIVAHSLYTQLYDSAISKHTPLILSVARTILDYEVAVRCATTATEQDDLLRQFWGAKRSVVTSQ